MKRTEEMKKETGETKEESKKQKIKKGKGGERKKKVFFK